MYGLIERGALQRTTGTTKLNELSSRSHAVFIIIIEKSTVACAAAAEASAGDQQQLEQFRGLAPGRAHLLSLYWQPPALACMRATVVL